MAPYPYQPLDLPRETRLLCIEPGGFEDAIICSMVHINLEKEKRTYQALSYCWSKSVNAEFIPPGDTEVAYAYGSEEGMSGQILFRDMLDHSDLHATYIQFGGQLAAGTILCDGVEVEVGGELHRAIRRIRSQEEPLRIWIDALCIDQKNLEEKSKHVLTMGAIYTDASHVRIWLGEETGIEQPAISALADIVNIANEAFGQSEIGNLNSFEIRKQLITHPKTADIDWESLQQFFSRAWFSRIWVLQEAANASKATVHLGRLTMDWDWLSEAIHVAKVFKLDTAVTSFSMKSLAVMEWLREGYTSNQRKKVSLLDLLEETRVFDSTISSDKVYAVLSLADPAVAVPVDYALPGEEIFTQLALQYLEKHRSLDILCHCMLPATASQLHLPSWIPDWTVQGWVEPFRSRGLRASAAGTSHSSFSIDRKNGELKIRGKRLSTIAAIETTKEITRLAETPKALGVPKYGIRKVNIEGGLTVDAPAHATLKDRNFSRHMYRRQEMAATLRDIHNVASPSGVPTQEVREAMARTLACNRTRDGSKLGANFKLGFDLYSMITCTDDTMEAVCRWMVQDATGASETSREGRAFHKKMMKAFVELTGSFEKWCFNRRFIRTANNTFGWVPNGAEVGDIIAMFYGASYPFVLRGQGQGKYKIIGDCYLDGFMDGEGMSSEYAEQEFVLV